MTLGTELSLGYGIVASMRILRTPAEVAELWLCPGFVPALHFTDIGDGSRGQRFEMIRRSGALQPARVVGTQNMTGLDVLAGDDGYVFLTPIHPPDTLSRFLRFGFVFDAEDLIASGAIVGETDLLPAYETRIAKMLTAKYGYRVGQELTRVLDANYLDTLREDFAERYAILARKDARRPRPLPVDELLNIITENLQQLSATRYHGEAALQYIVGYAEYVCGVMHKVLDTITPNAETLAPDFIVQAAVRSKYMSKNARSVEALARADSAVELCVESLRRTVLDQKILAPFFVSGAGMMRKIETPEILWPGALPIDRAVALIMLPEWEGTTTGLRWPAGISYVPCQRFINPAPTAGLGARSRAAREGTYPDIDIDIDPRALRFVS